MLSNLHMALHYLQFDSMAQPFKSFLRELTITSLKRDVGMTDSKLHIIIYTPKSPAKSNWRALCQAQTTGHREVGQERERESLCVCACVHACVRVCVKGLF